MRKNIATLKSRSGVNKVIESGTIRLNSMRSIVTVPKKQGLRYLISKMP